MIRKLLLAAALAAASPAALAAPTYIHAGRVIAVPGKAPLGPSTIVVVGDPMTDVTVLKQVDFVMARSEVVKTR